MKVRVKLNKRETTMGLSYPTQVLEMTKEQLTTFLLEKMPNTKYYNKSLFFDEVTVDAYKSYVKDCMDNEYYEDLCTYSAYVRKNRHKLEKIIAVEYNGEGIYNYETLECLVPLDYEWVEDDVLHLLYTDGPDEYEETIEINWNTKEVLL
jgi:hypothetical protein